MERRLFFTCPIDHTTLGDWPAFARLLGRAAAQSCAQDVGLAVGDRPVFGPVAAEPTDDGAPTWVPHVDTEETLLALAEDRQRQRAVRIDLWSSYPGHAAVCITLGAAIRRGERRELLRRIPKATRRRCTLLREHIRDSAEGSDDLETARVVGHRLSPDDDRDRSTIADILSPIDVPFYLCERWLLQDDGGRLDEHRFEIHRELGPDLVFCSPLLDASQAAQAEAQERLWSNATRGAGLLALYPDDSGLETLARRFPGGGEIPGRGDLHTTLVEAPDPGLRVSIGRGHPQLVVLYQGYWEGEGSDRPAFVL